MAEVAASFKRNRSAGGCLAPLKNGQECGVQAIRSHLVSRTQLEAIAVDGHVHALTLDVMQQWLHDLPPVGRVGIGNASTFPGFCPKHDSALFEPLDRLQLELSAKSSFLLAYRALCREVLRKRQEIASKQEELDMPAAEELLDRLDEIRFERTRLEILGWRDMEMAKLRMDECLLRGDFSAVDWAGWTTTTPLPLLAASYTCPGIGFDWEPLQDVGSEHPAFYVAVSVLNTPSGGVLHLSWLRGQGPAGTARALIRSLQSAEVDTFLTWLLHVSESVFFSDTWWKSATPEKIAAVRELAAVPPVRPSKPLFDGVVDRKVGITAKLSRAWPPPSRARRRKRPS